MLNYQNCCHYYEIYCSWLQESKTIVKLTYIWAEFETKCDRSWSRIGQATGLHKCVIKICRNRSKSRIPFKTPLQSKLILLSLLPCCNVHYQPSSSWMYLGQVFHSCWWCHWDGANSSLIPTSQGTWQTDMLIVTQRNHHNHGNHGGRWMKQNGHQTNSQYICQSVRFTIIYDRNKRSF